MSVRGGLEQPLMEYSREDVAVTLKTKRPTAEKEGQTTKVGGGNLGTTAKGLKARDCESTDLMGISKQKTLNLK